MQTSVVIEDMFRGPPRSGNGGYVTGLVAGLWTGGRLDLPQQQAVEVTLRAPVPLDQQLAVIHGEGQLRVTNGEQLIAEASIVRLSLEVPQPASFDEALAARDTSASLQRGKHPFFAGERTGFHPVCFCCGAELAPDAGLHVYAAVIADRSQVAAAWTAPSRFARADGTLPPEIVCAALDCPGQFAWLAQGVRTGLLGRLTPRIERPIRAGERCVVIGWTMGHERKKFFAGTALFNEQRELCAYASSVWIGRHN